MVNDRFGRNVPRGELVDCDGGVGIQYLVGGVVKWVLPTSVATASSGGRSGSCSKYDRIVFVQQFLLIISDGKDNFVDSSLINSHKICTQEFYKKLVACTIDVKYCGEEAIPKNF